MDILVNFRWKSVKTQKKTEYECLKVWKTSSHLENFLALQAYLIKDKQLFLSFTF